MPNYTFVTPVIAEGPAGGHRLFQFRKLDRGITVVGAPGAYQQVRYLQDEVLNTYSEIYRGGYNYTVNAATKAALIAGGVGVTEANFTAQ